MDKNTIHKGRCFFFMPFKLTDKWQKRIIVCNSWERAANMNVEEGMFYPHILHFVTGNSEGFTSFDFQIYTPKGKDRIYMLNQEFEVDLPVEDKSCSMTVKMNGSPSSFLGPKLIICPGAATGMLILALSIENDKHSISELMALNYHLHKTISGLLLRAIPKRTYSDYCNYVGKIDRVTDLDKLHSFEDLLNKKKTKLIKELNMMRQWNDSEPLGEDVDIKQNYSVNMTMNDIVNYLMRDLNGCYTRLNAWRFHVLTFLHVNDEQACSHEDLVRLMHCQDKSYQVLGQDKVIETFKNVKFGASSEGGFCFIACSDRNNDFFEGFDTGVFCTRYLWLYLITMMQRSALNIIEADLTSIDDVKTQSGRLDIVRRLSERISRIRVSLSFENVSDITQHNAFCSYLESQFDMPRHWNSIEKKSDSMERWLVRYTEQRADNFRSLLLVVISLWSVTSMLEGGLCFIQRFFPEGTSVYVLIGVLFTVLCLVVGLTFVVRYFYLKISDRSRN